MRSFVVGVACLGGVALLGGDLAAQQESWWGRDPRLSAQAVDAPGGEFRFEMPRRDWELTPGGGSVVAALAQRRFESMIFIEYTRLNQPLAPDDITELFAELEVDRLRQQQPNLGAVDARILDVDGRRIVAVQYRRTGTKGGETVRQYSMPLGVDLYRVVCSTLTARLAQHEAVCRHVAASFEAR